MHKPRTTPDGRLRLQGYKNKKQALIYAKAHFPNENIKGFVRETEKSFRVRVVPKTQFIETSYVNKPITPDITLVFGYLKKTRAD
jgi:hypothetical protein